MIAAPKSSVYAIMGRQQSVQTVSPTMNHNAMNAMTATFLMKPSHAEG
jgi:hypothetical protein